MKYFPFYEKNFFIPALLLSVSIHGFLLGASGWISSLPQISVINAPSSLEVTVINQPVVTIIEEEIVSQAFIESDAFEEIVLNDHIREPLSERNLASSAASLESRGAITKAEPLAHMNPAPPYPRVARQHGWEGIVRLEVFVGKNGIPEDVAVQESSGYDVLDQSALETIEKWKFSPARSSSMRFSSRITIPVQFTLIRKQ